jgi:YbbR domain-containing protein
LFIQNRRTSSIDDTEQKNFITDTVISRSNTADNLFKIYIDLSLLKVKKGKRALKEQGEENGWEGKVNKRVRK